MVAMCRGSVVALMISNVAERKIVVVSNMGERWKKFRSGTLRTMLAGVLYVITLPAVRNWLMNLLTGKARKDQKVIDVDAKK